MVNVNAFYNIEGWMINEFKGKGKELDCFAIIYSYSRGELGKFIGGFKCLAGLMNCSETTASRFLDSLIEKDLVIKEEIVTNTGRRTFYKTNEEKVNIIREKQFKLFEKDILSKRKEGYFQNESMGTFILKVNNKYSNNQSIERKRLSNDNQKAPDELFLKFWELYGYKKGKVPAIKAWNKLNKEQKEAAIKGIPVYMNDCLLHERQKKHPATYLNQMTWEDDFDNDGMVSDGECFAGLPEGLTQQEWERANHWMIVNIPRLSGSISAEMHLRMVKMTHSKADVYAAILKEIEASDYDDDLMPEFERLCNTKYKERIEA